MENQKRLELAPPATPLNPMEMLRCHGGGDYEDAVLKLLFGPWEPPPSPTGTLPTFPC